MTHVKACLPLAGMLGPDFGVDQLESVEQREQSRTALGVSTLPPASGRTHFGRQPGPVHEALDGLQTAFFVLLRSTRQIAL